jgi:long-chain fatty acid transport protein
VFYLHAFNTAKRRVDQSALGAGDGEFKLDADGGGWGYDVGLLFKWSDSLRIGLSYRSHAKVNQSGDVELTNIAPALQPAFGGASFSTPVSTTVDFPEMLGFGIAYRPMERLTLAFDVEWARWSRFDEQGLDLEIEVPGAGFSDTSITLDWNDAWAIKLGAEYELDDKLALRFGYAYVGTPVPSHTLSPASPDADQQRRTRVQHPQMGCRCFLQRRFFRGHQGR